MGIVISVQTHTNFVCRISFFRDDNVYLLRPDHLKRLSRYFRFIKHIKNSISEIFYYT